MSWFRVVILACDVCEHELDHPAQTVNQARLVARLTGWLIGHRFDVCPECVTAGWSP